MRIGIVRYWADRPAAEHEVIARLSAAAAARGHRVVDLHPDGSCINEADGAVVLDFVLNLHFATPKVLDLPHVGPLWNPVRFYHHFGFTPHFANQLSHDYLASCGSRTVDRAFAPFRPDLFDAGLPVLNHTVPERYLDPRRRGDRAAFYVGINWERMSGGPGRHDTLLRLLDAQGLSAIHGPEEIDGIRPWAGFTSYRGPLPFDGWSVIEAIADAGAALVFSSSEHYRDGVMSCRPFEAAAAGVPLISEHHPFMMEHFADAALFFDERAPVAEQAEEIAGHLRRLNADPDFAYQLAQRAQERLRSEFNLDDQLDSLCTWVAQREQARFVPQHADATALIVPIRGSGELREWMVSNAPALSRFDEVVIAPPDTSQEWANCQDVLSTRVRTVVSTRADTTWSERASRVAVGLDGPLCFLLGVEDLWQHYADQVAGCAGQARLVPGVGRDDWPGRAVNERIPTLLCGRTVDWFNLPIASVAVRADYISSLVATLGPGVHLGVAAQQALCLEDPSPAFQPAFTVSLREARIWTLDAWAGEEQVRDACFVAALPSRSRPDLPASVAEQVSPPDDLDRLVTADFTLPETSVRVATGFSHVERQGGDQWWWATDRRAALDVANASAEPRVGTLEFELHGPPGVAPQEQGGEPTGQRMVTVLLPDGAEQRLAARGQTVTLRVIAPPGHVSMIEFVCEGEAVRIPGDDRDLWWQFKKPTLLLATSPGPAIVEAATASSGTGLGSPGEWPESGGEPRWRAVGSRVVGRARTGLARRRP